MAQSGLSPRRRTLALASLALAVGLGHGCVDELLGRQAFDLRQRAQAPPRIEVAYVRELSLQAPPSRGVTASPKRSRRSAPVATEVVAALVTDTPASAVPPEPLAPEPAPEAMPPAPEAVAAASAPAVVASTPTAPAFDWPESTRLSYVLTGHYQGEIHGTGQVEWIRLGDRYQVHVDVTVGLSFAPMMSRRMSSEGTITATGLSPSRYDQVTKVAFSDARYATLHFTPGRVTLHNGRQQPTWPGVQDTASQFVQMVWWFGMQPERLRAGQTFELPLALPRGVDRWAYEVQQPEVLDTPFGALDAVHVKTRRLARPGGDLVPEMWLAPGLRYLPVRIRIHQDAETYLDLMIDRKPQLAAGP